MPIEMVLEIEPAKLLMRVDCEVSIDALNYLGNMDEMSNAERNRFLAVNNSSNAFTDFLMTSPIFTATCKTLEVSPLIFRERQYLFHALLCRL